MKLNEESELQMKYYILERYIFQFDRGKKKTNKFFFNESILPNTIIILELKIYEKIYV